MEAIPGRQRLTLPIAPAVALAVAALSAFAVMVMPVDVLEDMVGDTGIASLLTAAAPPLGMTARLGLAFLAALLMGGLLWFGLGLMLGKRAITFRRPPREEGVPVLRRADAHPDAPPRRPVFANSDLGTPFLDVRAEPRVTGERPLPRDLDTPLSAYLHPLDAPLPPPEPARDAKVEPAPLHVGQKAAEPLPIRSEDAAGPATVEVPEPLAAPLPAERAMESASGGSDADSAQDRERSESRFAAHERIETFELTPLIRDETVAEPAPSVAEPLPSATIHDLLERLERGVARRSPASAAQQVRTRPAPAASVSQESIEQTLAVLRQLATRRV